MSNKTPNKRIKRSVTRISSFLPKSESHFDVEEKQIITPGLPNLFKYMHASTASRMAGLLLCVSFFLQGFNYAEAAESEEVAPEAPTVDVLESIPEPETVEEEVVELPPTEEVFETSDAPALDIASEEALTIDTSLETANQTETVEEEEVLPDEVVEPEEVLGESDEEQESDNTTGGAEDEAVDLEVDDSSSSTTIDTDVATSSELVEEALPGTTESVSSVNLDTAYTFNREECTKLATGSYYCLKPVEGMLEDALFAAPDEDGDLEIFLVRGGVQTQVTMNQVDDAAPYYDENSNTIVWHRLHNERFQIVSYEIDSGEETLLTNTSENNMEPTRQGNFTVWQRWVDGSWNIIVHDGESETKLTNHSGHNVAPYVHGSLVVWNRHNTDGQKTIEMYDMDTSTFVSVPDAEGLSVSNPRMVFVFDSLTPEGDLITKGYDVLSRKFIDLDSLPKNLPDEIPNSDSTGETRALIQSKPTVKTDIEELLESEPDGPQLPPEPVIDSLTLNLATSTEIVMPTVILPEATSEFDLVILPYNASTTSSSSEQTNP